MSSGLTQLRLLLWRDILRRQRKPVTLFLEVVWPIVLFSVVILVRQGALPVRKPTCHYRPWMLPSSGGLNFLQSFICNFENDCRGDLQFGPDGQLNDTRVTKLKGTVTDLMSVGTGRILDLLPKTSRVVGDVSDIIAQPSVNTFIKSETKVRDILRNPDAIGYELQNTLGVLSRETTNAILNSKIRTANLPLAGNLVDLRLIMCDPNVFRKYFSLPPGYRITTDELSAALCDIPNDKIKRMTDIIHRQFNITHFTKYVAQQLGSVEFGVDTIFEGLLGMLQVLANLDNAGSLLGDYAALGPLLQGLRYSTESVQELSSAARELLGVIEYIKADGRVNIAEWLFQPDKWAQLQRGAGAFMSLMKVFNLVNVQVKDVNFGQLFASERHSSVFLDSFGLDSATVNTLEGTKINTTQFVKMQRELQQKSDRQVFCSGATLSSIFNATTGKEIEAVKAFQEKVCSSQQPSNVGTLLFSSVPQIVKDSLEPVTKVTTTNQTFLDMTSGTVTRDFLPFINTFQSLGGGLPTGINQVLGGAIGRRKRQADEQRQASRWSLPNLLDSIRGVLGRENGNTAKAVSNFIDKLLAPAGDDMGDPIFVVLKDVLIDSGSLSEFLTKTFKAAPQFTKALMDSSVDLQMLTGLLGGRSNIKSIVCNPLALAGFLRFDKPVDINQMSFELCYNTNSTALESYIVDKVNSDFIVDNVILPKLPRELLSEEWWDANTKDLDVILSGVSTGVDVLNIFNTLQDNDLAGAITGISKFVSKNSGSGGSGGGSFLGLLGGVFKDNIEAQQVITGVTSLAGALLTMDAFRPKLILEGQVADYVMRKDIVANQLHKEIGLPLDMAWAWLDSNFTFVYKLSLIDLKVASAECNSVYFSTLLELPKGVNDTWVYEELCNVNPALMNNVTELVLRNVKLGEFFQQFVQVSPSGLLKKQNMTEDEIDELVTLLGPASGAISSLAEQLGDPNLSGEDNSTGGGGVLQIMDKANYAFCGVKRKVVAAGEEEQEEDVSAASAYFDAEQNFDYTKVNPDEIPYSVFGPDVAYKMAAYKWSDKHRSELAEFGDDEFCKDMYRYIQAIADSGSLIWTAVKPLMRGRILFTPDTMVTRDIMNKTADFFEGTKNLRKTADAWDQVVLSMMKLGDSTNDLSSVDAPDLADALRSNMLNAVAFNMFGISGQTLADRLDSGSSLGLSKADLETTHQLLGLVYNVTGCFDLKVIGYPSYKEMVAEAKQLQLTNTLLGGIVFDSLLPKEREKRASEKYDLPKFFEYTIRMDPDVGAGTGIKAFLNSPNPRDNFIDDLRYIRGFSLMQDLIDHGILETYGIANEEIPKVNLHQNPSPCWSEDLYSFYGGFIVALLMVFVWLCMMAVGIVNLVSDKEKGIAMSLQVMGMNSTVSWWSWFISTMTGMIVMSFLICLFLKYGQLLRLANLLILFIMLIIYSFSVCMMCYLVSVFFRKTTLAALVGLLLYLLSCLPYIIGYNMEFSVVLPIYGKIAICSFATSAFMTACYELVYQEQRALGIQWDNLNDKISAEFTFMHAMGMCLLDGVVYGLIAWYVSNVAPGPTETAQPFYFFLMPSYWGLCKKDEDPTKRMHFTNYHRSISEEASAAVHGERDPDLPIGISLHKITKIYKKGKPAVDDLTVNFFQNQVTAFLGHNGAGKTSTIHMLTGVFEPTTGKAYVNGRSIHSQMKDIRQSLGFCPQYDILYDFMTVEEHLEFYLKLKSKHITNEECKKESKRLLEVMALERSAKQIAVHLSGGQKRRLSVGIAFAGGSKVVILDEPTSGVDPAARRNIWDIVVSHTEGRTIILSTHHLDEAEIIGDRIVMIHQGKTVCVGSPMFLKNYYASGYHLTVAKELMGSKAEALTDTLKKESLCKSSDVLRFIQKVIPDARLVEEIGTEMTFILPVGNDYVTLMKKLFGELDRNKSKLFIHTYGLSDTTLEEIFLKVTQAAEEGLPLDPESLKEWTMMKENEEVQDGGSPDSAFRRARRRSSATTISSYYSDSIADSDAPALPPRPDFNRLGSMGAETRIEGSALKIRQFQALLIKRFHHFSRSKRTYMAQIILPVLFVIVAMASTRMRAPPWRGEPKTFPIHYTYYSPGSSFFVRRENITTLNTAMYDQLKDGLIGTTCMDEVPERFRDHCTYPTTNEFAPVFVKPELREKWNDPPDCNCKGAYQSCPAGAEGERARRLLLPTGDVLDDYTLLDMNTEEYLLRSDYHYPFRAFRNRSERLGGWTFAKTDDDKSATTVWFNNRAHQAIPILYNAHTNMVYRAHMKKNQVPPDTVGIAVNNHRLPLPPDRASLAALFQNLADAGIALILMAAMCFVPPGFINYLINERVNKEKRLQFICGVGTSLYWFTAFLWDMISYCITVGLVIAVTFAFGVPMYTARANLLAFSVILVLFGWSSIPMEYLLSRFFQDASVSYMVLFLINLFIGINTTALMLFFSMPVFVDAQLILYTKAILEKIFLIFPQYCLGDALLRLSMNQLLTEVLESFGLVGYKEPFTADMMLWHVVVMAAEGLIFLGVLLLLEARLFVITNPTGTGKAADYKEDSDVGLERQRVVTGDAKEDVLVLYNMTKDFRRGFESIKAVDSLCLGIPRGECFGLLGINGAGKTTTFKMITGDLQPSSGAAMLNGKIISEDEGNMDQNVGYCPQYDALDEMLTGREMLFFYGRLKGIPLGALEQCCETAMMSLGLEPHINKRTINLSAGNKRKLSTAVAILGDPALVLMDEPTTGMDPGTRRLVWDNITKIIKDNRSVILTSHSMAECDALCTRMAIMVNGQFMCLGSGQHLKNKFGNGYTVTVRVGGEPPDIEGFKYYMDHKFPRSKLKDHHLRQLEYEVPLKSSPLSELFGAFEEMKQQGALEDFSVTQTTLDQVFLHFARKQGDGLVDDEDDFEDDRRSVISHLTTRSNETIRSLFSVMSGRKTFRRRGRFRVEDHIQEPSIHDQVQFSMDDWNYQLPDDLIDQIKLAPGGPDGKAYLRETLASQLPPQMRHAPAAVLNRYLGSDVRQELHDKRRQYKQHGNRGVSRRNNVRGTIARRQRNRKNSRNHNMVIQAGIETPPADISVNDLPIAPPPPSAAWRFNRRPDDDSISHISGLTDDSEI